MTHSIMFRPDITKTVDWALKSNYLSCFHSKNIHQLIEQSLKTNEEEAFTYFKETADILDKKAQVN